MLNLEKIEFEGWAHCLRLSNDTIELVVTTEVGPRIIYMGWKDRPGNLFYVEQESIGRTGDENFQLYGGHRLWHAPEIKPRTYVPDNSPVAHDWDGRTLRLVPDVEQLTGLQKIMEIRLHETLPTLSINHQIINHGPWEVTAAPWALTVLNHGGTAIIPQEPFVPFPDALLPARPLVVWSYTNMQDERFHWGPKYISMRQDPSRNEQLKFGVRNSVGWGCYVIDDTVFIKGSTLKPDATYPDFGCNWELFTNSRFLELETLGPLQPLAAQGGMAEHLEEWSLARVTQPANMEEIFQHVQDLNAVVV